MDVTLLPHWARVAFAARCARRIAPLFQRFWQDALAKRFDSVLLAIQLAEQSSAEGRASEGLKAAMANACGTAGAALLVVYGLESKEPTPVNAESALLASFIAKAAEKAAEAALATPSSSKTIALESPSYAEQVARGVSEITLLVDIEDDFDMLQRAVVKGRWRDNTPVPPSVWPAIKDFPAREHGI